MDDAQIYDTIGEEGFERLVALFYRQVPTSDRGSSVIRLPSFDAVANDPILYAHASRILHLESNPGNARALVQRHGNIDVWLNPPPIPLAMKEMDAIYELPYRRVPHPFYENAKIPAYEMIRFSVNIMRGCFGGCTFCSITEHEGRIIQNRSHESIIREIEEMRDKVPGFTGVVSDLGGPTANMYRIACKSPEIESACRKPSCVFPGICPNLNTDHSSLIELYRKARTEPGIRKVLVASGIRMDLAQLSPEYLQELAAHHVGGHLKVAPEHTDPNVLGLMKKPTNDNFESFADEFRKASDRAGKPKQYLVPYYISGHPGSDLADMIDLALYLKSRGLRPRQVQDFIPTPMSLAATMYHSGLDPLTMQPVYTAKGLREKKLQKALLLYWDPQQQPLVREALQKAGRLDLVGHGPHHLVTPGPLPDGLRIGVRPEHVRLAAADGATARVRLVEPAGAEDYVHLELDGTELVARTPAEARPELGAEVGIEITPWHTHLFDAATGERVAWW